MTEPLVSMNREGNRTKFDYIYKEYGHKFMLSRGAEWPKAGPMTGVKS